MIRAEDERNQTIRTAKTRRGKTVPLNTLQPVDGGWTGYILNADGVAVAIFIPSN